MSNFDVSIITEIRSTPGAIHRTLNHGLMVDWINRDLVNRAANDVRRSTVLYDAGYLFTYALPAGIDLPEDAWEGLHAAGIRYWSRGIV